MSGRGRDLLGRWIDGVRGVFGAAPVKAEAEERPGGPFLHWVPDHDGRFRLAGDFLPPSTGRPRTAPIRSRRRSRRV